MHVVILLTVVTITTMAIAMKTCKSASVQQVRRLPSKQQLPTSLSMSRQVVKKSRGGVKRQLPKAAKVPGLHLAQWLRLQTQMKKSLWSFLCLQMKLKQTLN